MVRRFCLIGVFIVLAALPGIAPADAAPPEQQPAGPITLDVHAGFGGYIQQNSYAPIMVVASNTGNDVSGSLSVAVGGLTGNDAIYSQPFELPRGSRKQVRLYPADFNAFGTDITVDFSQAGQSLANQKVKVSFIDQHTLLIGIWSDSPGTLASLGKVVTSSGKAAVATLTADDLPPLAAAWDALDVLVISDTDTGKLAPDQRAALEDWVAQGGRLIVTGGPDFQRTLAGLGALSPVAPTTTQNVSLDVLGQTAGQPFSQSVSDAPVATGVLAQDAHVLLASGDGIPLVAWRHVGYGRVDFLAADPGIEPLRSWANVQSLWTLILQDGEPRPSWAYGFNTGTDQAQQAIAAVPGVTLPSTLELCGFLMVYVILIGPVNYLILWRLRRRELAWFTVPALVVLFAAVAYVTGFQLRGTQAILHRLAVIETWPGSDRGELRMLFGVWSPGRTTYDIQIEPGYLARPLPRDLSGALTSPSAAHIEDDQTVTLRGVQVDIGSVQPFVIEGSMPNAPRIEGTLTITPTDTGLRLQGDISNYSNLSLTSVSLITPIGSKTQSINDLPAGGVLKVDESLDAVGYSSAATGDGLEPFPPNNYGGYYSGYSASSLASDLTAGEDCYDVNKDRRRCNLAASILTGDIRGTGVYLAGWSDTVPLRTQVLSAAAQEKDLALVIVKLSVAVAKDATLKTIPPGLMTWKITDNSANNPSTTPYGLYLNAGMPVIIRYQPLSFIPLPQIDQLVIHLDSYDQSHLPQVELWNVNQARWEPVQVQWGDTSLPGAAYVDNRGGVMLQVQASDTATLGTSLNRLDVTLVGQ